MTQRRPSAVRVAWLKSTALLLLPLPELPVLNEDPPELDPNEDPLELEPNEVTPELDPKEDTPELDPKEELPESDANEDPLELDPNDDPTEFEPNEFDKDDPEKEFVDEDDISILSSGSELVENPLLKSWKVFPNVEEPLDELPEKELDELGEKDEVDPLPENELGDGLPIIVWKLEGWKLLWEGEGEKLDEDPGNVDEGLNTADVGDP